MNLLEFIKEIKTKNQKILIVGLGISGSEAANVLSDSGFKIIAVDKSSLEDFKRKGQDELIDQLKTKGIEVHLGIDGEQVAPYLSNVGLCVLSPGVSLEASIVAAVQRAGIVIANELELAISLIEAPTIVVTGSNGKSTTVTLITEMLKASQQEAKLCGNVGLPVISLLNNTNIFSAHRVKVTGPLVVEASSYQLETCHHLHPKVSVWLNISENHLERHGTIDRYLAIKGKIFTLQSDLDYSIFNLDDDRYLSVISMIKGRRLPFGRDKNKLEKISNEYAFINYSPSEGIDLVTVRLNNSEETYDLNEFKLLGVHNRYNVAASLLASKALNGTYQGCLSALKSFTGLRHRFQSLGDISGVMIINDSKSTTVAASCAALNSAYQANPNSYVHLLLGGMVKAGSWSPLTSLLRGQILPEKPVVCFGGDGHIILNHLRAASIPCVQVRDVKEAFHSSMSRATSGDIVLFSPGCASFDEFQNFEKRGEALEKLFLDYGTAERASHSSTPITAS